MANEERPPELDARFTLANERTFLAWLRTALGLLAGGVALDRLGPDGNSGDGGTAHSAVVGLCVLLSVGLVIGGYLRWASVQRSLQAGEAVAVTPLVSLLAVGVVVLAVGSLFIL